MFEEVPTQDTHLEKKVDTWANNKVKCVTNSAFLDRSAFDGPKAWMHAVLSKMFALEDDRKIELYFVLLVQTSLVKVKYFFDYTKKDRVNGTAPNLNREGVESVFKHWDGIRWELAGWIQRRQISKV